MAGAPKGNKNAVKLDSPELKHEAYRQYCAHLAEGYAQESFVFVHPEISITYKTLNKHIAENPIEFPPIQKEQAYIQGYAVWEKVVAESARGNNTKANTASLQMLMRNKFKWDKQDKDANGAKEDTTEELSSLRNARPSPRPPTKGENGL